jgi:hypothetical protein
MTCFGPHDVTEKHHDHHQFFTTGYYRKLMFRSYVKDFLKDTNEMATWINLTLILDKAFTGNSSRVTNFICTSIVQSKRYIH